MNIARTALLMMIWLICQPVIAAAFNNVQPLSVMPSFDDAPVEMRSAGTCHELMATSTKATAGAHHLPAPLDYNAQPTSLSCSMDDSHTCCDVQCHCLAGGCASILSSQPLAGAFSTQRIQNTFHSVAFPQAFLSSLFRPPISA